MSLPHHAKGFILGLQLSYTMLANNQKAIIKLHEAEPDPKVRESMRSTIATLKHIADKIGRAGEIANSIDTGTIANEQEFHQLVGQCYKTSPKEDPCN